MPERCAAELFGEQCLLPAGHTNAHSIAVHVSQDDPTARELIEHGRRIASEAQQCSDVYRKVAERGIAADRRSGSAPDGLDSVPYVVGPRELDLWDEIHKADISILINKRSQYGNSWKARGGTGAFHVGIRHSDRIEAIASRYGFDLFAALKATTLDRSHSLLEAIGDLRRYLTLWEGEYRLRADDLPLDDPRQPPPLTPEPGR